jgi:AraC-like DNA-binding protein
MLTTAGFSDRGSPRLLDVPPLKKIPLVAGNGFRSDDVRCTSDHVSWSAPEPSHHYALVFVRQGCFRRRADGIETVLDAASFYVERPGQEQQIAHPHGRGDLCTQILLTDELADELHVDRLLGSREPIFTSPEIDVAHRRFAAGSSDGDEFVAVDRLRALTSLLPSRSPNATRDARRRRSVTAASHRRTVDLAREIISRQPTIPLRELARAVSTSPHHLSRIFHSETGETISRYRNRIRVRCVLEKLRDGDSSLARLSAELGFTDQAHLCRVFRAELGVPPSSLRPTVAAAETSAAEP